jgi:hypothetical protein
MIKAIIAFKSDGRLRLTVSGLAKQPVGYLSRLTSAVVCELTSPASCTHQMADILMGQDLP